MAKTFRKIILGTAVIGAAAAGIHHILNSKDRLDDFDDFDDEINDDLEEFLKEEAENSEREYVPLDLSGEKKAADDDGGVALHAFGLALVVRTGGGDIQRTTLELHVL